MLEKLQFRCLKIIQRLSRFKSNDFFRKLPDYQSIENRFDYLNTNYIQKSLQNNNPFKDLEEHRSELVLFLNEKQMLILIL